MKKRVREKFELSSGFITATILLVSIALPADRVLAEEGGSSQYFKGVSFKNANKIEFKYKERLKNFKEQLEMGKKKGWLTENETLAFQKKLDVLAKTEGEVSSKNYPKEELDKMEKMFTLYNQEFYKASNTPMEKKLKAEKQQKETKTTKVKDTKKKESKPPQSSKKKDKK